MLGMHPNCCTISLPLTIDLMASKASCCCLRTDRDRGKVGLCEDVLSLSVFIAV